MSDARSIALEAAYMASADRMPGVSMRQFCDALAGADIHPVMTSGECVGAVIVARHELHACVLPKAQGRWFGKQHLRILAGVLQRYGVAATSATTAAGVEFVKRLGFRQFGDKWLKGLSYGD